jgi:hypothetical protein
VSWDCNGVEFFQEITEHHPDNWAKNHLFDSIKESKKVQKPMSFSIQALKLRAQANMQRHYEIYVISSDEDVGPEYIKDWFTRDPQGFADWARKYHSYKICDHRAQNKAVIV